MFSIYILLSEKDRRTYVGYTKNLGARLREHNSGRVFSTKKRIPLKIFLTENFQTIQEAKQGELWWKSSSGRRRLREIFRN